MTDKVKKGGKVGVSVFQLFQGLKSKIGYKSKILPFAELCCKLLSIIPLVFHRSSRLLQVDGNLPQTGRKLGGRASRGSASLASPPR